MRFSFAIIGGGLTGVEFAMAIREAAGIDKLALVAIQPPGKLDIREDFYLVPILDHEDVYLGNEMARILKVSSVPLQLNVMVDRVIAYFCIAGTGAVSVLHFGNRLMQFPLGVLGRAEHVRLLHKGREVPAQVTVTGRWRDASVKWVLVQFLANVPAKQKAQYQVEFGRAVRRAAVTRGAEVDAQPPDAVGPAPGERPASLRARQGSLFLVIRGRHSGFRRRCRRLLL